MSLYTSLGVPRVVNACGIYTDLGGSVLSPGVLAAVAEASVTWASMDTMLEASGKRIAALCGAEAARVVPGASAGIALSVAACVARGSGAVAEALPACDAVVAMQRGHEYKYARCAALAGARVSFVDGLRFDGAVAVLHPAHLDGVAVPLEEVVASTSLPVIVDAAYQVEDFERWASAGDLVCFSAKYFGGPNAGGFVTGRSGLVADLAALDFVGYESGDWRTFGRAYKLDRACVAAVVAALQEWRACDHAARWSGYAALAGELAALLPGARLSHFTFEEELVDDDGRANAVVLDGAGELTAPLAAGDPSVRAIVQDGALVFCTEALTGNEVQEIGVAMSALWPN